MSAKSILIVCGCILVALLAWGVTFNNGLVTLQEQIITKHDDNKQVYSSIQIKIEQSGLVANTYSNKVIEGIEVAMSKRYGDGGLKGAMTWVQEKNPEIDPSVFKKIQQLVESEFTRFAANQKTLLDHGRTYRTKIRKFPGSFLAGMLGFSKADIEPYMTVLTTKSAQESFSTGTMTAPNTFGN